LIRSLIVGVVALAACRGFSPDFTCAEDSQCVKNGASGFCVAFDGPPGVCAFASSACTSGYAYDSSAGDKAGLCVDFPAGTDLSMSDATIGEPPDTATPPHCMQDSDCVHGGLAPCGGVCNQATGTCEYGGTEIDCGSTCTGGTETRRTCDGAGSCVSTEVSCGFYVCDSQAHHCRSSCSDGATDCNQALCTTTNQCVACPADMVFVPAGVFTMGWSSPPNDAAVTVTLTKPYCVDKYEVSVAQYRACVNVGTCTAAVDGAVGASDCSFTAGAGANDALPVNCVTHGQAQVYCSWAGLSGGARRLPSEAEWERAARGTDARTYPWGPSAPDCTYAQIMDNGNAGCGSAAPYLTPVTGHSPKGDSPTGLANAAGNVSEWVSDCYVTNYTAGGVCAGTCTDPVAPTTAGCTYAIRGNAARDVTTVPNFATYRRAQLSALQDLPRAGIRCAK
jgi:formylglycine-generating enzyme required for sulfatase activity